MRESIDMGDFKGTSRDLSTTLSDLRRSFPGSEYNILTKNCNSFSDEFLKRLVGKEIPGYVNRLAFIGNMFSCLIPPSVLNGAPVDSVDPSAGQARITTTQPIQPFQGQGMKLGSGTATDSFAPIGLPSSAVSVSKEV